MTKSWSQRFSSFKTKLRSRLKNDDAMGGEPKGIDPRTWRKFVENESDPKKQHQNVQNAENRKSLGSFRCYSCRSSAKQHVHLSLKNAENRENMDSSNCFGPEQHIMVCIDAYTCQLLSFLFTTLDISTSSNKIILKDQLDR